MKKILAVLLILPLLAANVAAEDEDEEVEVKPVAKYFKLTPDFIVNLKSSGRMRLMSITAQVMGFGDEVIEVTQHHLPAIRHHLLMLFTEQTYDDMNTVSGKKSLLDKSLTAVNGVLEAESKGNKLDAIYFTSFILQ